MKKENKLIDNTALLLIASLTLGLAPFFPEPHIWGKVKWILGGGAFSGETSMGFADWFDVVMHGTPWLLLIISLLRKLIQRK